MSGLMPREARSSRRKLGEEGGSESILPPPTAAKSLRDFVPQLSRTLYCNMFSHADLARILQ